MFKDDHKEVTELWRDFKKNFGENATAEQIQQFAEKIMEEFGDKMIRD